MAAKKTPQQTKDGEERQSATVQPKGDATVAGVFAQMAKLASAERETVARPLTDEHLAALHTKRLRHFNETQDPKRRALILRENAADLGLEVAEYQRQMKEAQEG